MPNSNSEKLQEPKLQEANKLKTKTRAIFSIIWRLIFAIAIIAGAIYLAFDMVSNKPEPPKRQARERSFTVEIITPQMGEYSPFVNAYGEIIAAKTFDVRAQVSGEALSVSKNLVVGGFLSKGEQILQIDPFDYEGAVRDARAALSDAQLQLTITKEQLSLEEINLDVARQQYEIGKNDLERAILLKKSGSLTEKDLENSQFLLSQREQTLEQRKSSLIMQQTAIERQKNTISRLQWSLDKAKHALENTRILSPFDAVVISKNVEQGRLVTNNEVAAKLYEQKNLEVSFTLSDSQYGYLLQSGLIGREVNVVWDIEPTPIKIDGIITRIGAQIMAASGGVEVFASLNGKELDKLKPGTFVEVAVAGIIYKNSYKLPETAIYEDNHIYLAQDGRMKRVDIELLSRSGQDVIISADIGKKSRVITTRLAQAGDGLKITIEGEEPQADKAEQDSKVEHK